MHDLADFIFGVEAGWHSTRPLQVHLVRLIHHAHFAVTRLTRATLLSAAVAHVFLNNIFLKLFIIVIVKNYTDKEKIKEIIMHAQANMLLTLKRV